MNKEENGIDTYDIKIYEGSEWKKTFQWLDGDKNPIDISGYGARFMIKPNKIKAGILVPDNEALVSLDESDGIGIGGTDGVFTVTIPTERTINWQVRFGYWALEVFPDPNARTDDVKRLIFGKAKYFKNEVIYG